MYLIFILSHLIISHLEGAWLGVEPAITTVRTVASVYGIQLICNAKHHNATDWKHFYLLSVNLSKDPPRGNMDRVIRT